MESVGWVFGLFSLILCMKLSARLTKMERMLKQSGFDINQSKSLYNVLVKNIGKSGTLTFCNGDSIFGEKKIICQILDVDEEWILLKENKKKEQRLLHIDSIRKVQI